LASNTPGTLVRKKTAVPALTVRVSGKKRGGLTFPITTEIAPGGASFASVVVEASVGAGVGCSGIGDSAAPTDGGADSRVDEAAVAGGGAASIEGAAEPQPDTAQLSA